MGEAKKASLTVLGGPLAGARLELPHEGVVTLGSAPDCTFPLSAPGVHPLHARLVLQGGRAMVHAAGPDRPVHVNDDPIGSESAAVRNGDILWLGVPGAENVVMLQCVLPTPPEQAAEEAGRMIPTPEIETTALWTTPPESAPAPPEAPAFGDQPTTELSPEEIQASRPTAAGGASPPAPTDEEPLVIAFDAVDEGVVVGEPDLVPADEALASADESTEAVVIQEEELFAPTAPTFVGTRDGFAPEAPGTPPAETSAGEPRSAEPEPFEPIPVEPMSAEPVPVESALGGTEAPDVTPEPPADVPVAEVLDDAAPVSEPLTPSVPERSSTEAPAQASSAPDSAAAPPTPDGSAPTVATPPAAESIPSGTPAAPTEPPPSASTRPAPSATAASTPRAPAAAKPPRPDASAPAVRRRDRPGASHPGVSQRVRRPARARPRVPPEDVLEEEGLEQGRGRSPALLAAAGFAGVLVVAGLGWAVWRFALAPSPAPTAEPVAAATPVLPPVAPPRDQSTPEPSVPDPTAAEPASTPETTPTPLPAPVEAVPEPTPTPPPAAAAAEPAPTPTPTPSPVQPAAAQPSAEELQQQQAQQTAERVRALLDQADAALDAGQHDEALTHLDEALSLDPQNTRGRAAQARAIALRDLARRRFVPTRTRVQTEKEQGGGLAGFDLGDADLRKAPDFQGRIEFEMNPATGLRGGAAWTLRIFVVNEGEKPIRIQGIETVTQVNGTGHGGSVAPRTGQVPTQQRVLVGELTGTWQEGTESWATQITVTANKGDSLRASLNWR